MKYAGYIWTVLRNLIALFITIALFRVARDNFETIVFSLLVLIYISVEASFNVYGLMHNQELFALDTEFKRVRKLLKDDENEFEKEQIDEAKEKMHNTMIKMYIKSVFIGIIYLLALWNLFNALLIKI